MLVAIAIDDRDRHVFADALAVARRHDAKLLLLDATPPAVSLNRGATERVAFLRQLRSLAEAAAWTFESLFRGPPSRARNADLIVLGTGRKESRRGLPAERMHGYSARTPLAVNTSACRTT